MNLLTRRKKTAKSQEGEIILLPFPVSNRGLDFLVELVKRIRPGIPKNIGQAELRFDAIQQQLMQDRSLLFSLRRSLLSQFLNTDIRPTLTESGIVRSRGLSQELMRKISHKILPALQKPTDFLFVLNRVFYSKRDYKWVEGMNPVYWKNFFGLLGIQINLTEPALISQLQESLQVLSYRVASTGLEREITERFDPFYSADYPFLEQNRLVNLYINRQEASGSEEERKLLLNNISETLHNCRQSIRWIKEQGNEYGISLAQTFLMLRMEQQIERMFIILDVLDSDQVFDLDRFIQYFCTVIRNENRKNSIWELLSNSLGLMAYRIAEHK